MGLSAHSTVKQMGGSPEDTNGKVRVASAKCGRKTNRLAIGQIKLK